MDEYEGNIMKLFYPQFDMNTRKNRILHSYYSSIAANEFFCEK